MRDFYSELPPFLQDYVRVNKWAEFRDVQKKSFEVLFDSDDDLLITSGTSSGKTEAAMFPVISSLYRKPCKGIGALYISPLKALIDDQFERIEEILIHADIKVTNWHGDVSQSVKKSLMRNPSGILQTTPESLQSLLFNYRSEMDSMFPELRFIIIDEVHAFMNSTRGLQLLCELELLSRITGCNPRRIGLSATLSDTETASNWLRGNGARNISVVECYSSSTPDLGLTFDIFPSGGSVNDPVNSQTNEVRNKHILDYYVKMFAETNPYNCIVFANSRLDAEKITRNIKIINRRMSSNKDVEIHHGSISKELRKDSESKIKNSQFGVTLISTSTLELGIDIGNIDRVVQKDPPYSCSSLVQRIGRSGRRTGTPVFRMFCTCDMGKDRDQIFTIPVNLIRGIALMELGLREKWVEPIRYSSLPFGLLYQQTMGFIHSNGGATFKLLCSNILSSYPFKNISETDYKIMLKHLMESGHIESFEGSFVISEKGEKVVNDIDFLATFSDDNKYEVISNGKLIGFIPKRPVPNRRILLAGRTWIVSKVSGVTVEVDKGSDDAVTNWDGGEPYIHEKIMLMMRKVLDSDEIYPYIDDNASEALKVARFVSKDIGFTEKIVRRSEDIVEIHPWVGSVQFDTLVRIIKKIDGMKIIGCVPLYYIRIVTGFDVDRVRKAIIEYANNADPTSLITKNDYLDYEKFDSYVPHSLLVKKFVKDKIDADFTI